MISSHRSDVDARGRIRRRQHQQQRQQQQDQASPFEAAGRELPDKEQQVRRPDPAMPHPGSQGADQ